LRRDEWALEFDGWVSWLQTKHYLRIGRCGQTPRAPSRRIDVLNRYDRPSPMAGEAELKYLDGDFRIIRPGAFVRCAVTGVPIPLEELKYWSVDRQEAYATPDAVIRRLHPARGR
jgi:hypothetical protein